MRGVLSVEKRDFVNLIYGQIFAFLGHFLSSRNRFRFYTFVSNFLFGFSVSTFLIRFVCDYLPVDQLLLYLNTVLLVMFVVNCHGLSWKY